MTNEGQSRRGFVAGVGAVAASALAARRAAAAGKKRYAIVGTGHRATGMWGQDVARQYADVIDFVGLCDINPLRVEVARTMIGVECPTFTSLDEMLDKTKPEILMVTTVDAYHAECIVKALERGIDVLTEKPMVIDESQCQAVLDAEKRTGKKVGVTFNYRFSPKHRAIKEVLLSGEIGDVTSVDFSWFLNVRHGADYYRRWHRLRSKSGSLWCHKASHHFDLINWWLDADPVEVSAFGSLRHYGKNGKLRGANCRSCAHKAECKFFWDIGRDPRLVKLYVDCEKADGYNRDGCVFREDVDIPDSMNAIVKYSTGAQMSYSVSTFMPIEGYHLAFNGTKGRLEIRDFEAQSFKVTEDTEIHVMANFGERRKVVVPAAVGGHGGGDNVLRDMLFRGTQPAAYMTLPTSRSGAMSCLTGVAARKSMDSGRPVRIFDLIRL